jgi:transposase
MVIIGAAMRKLIHIIYGVLKNNTPFNENIAV